NTDKSVTAVSAASGGIFRDYMANYYGGYAQKIETLSVLHAELTTLILAMELAHIKNWNYLWLESDSRTALRTFDNINLVPWDLRNRWTKLFELGTKFAMVTHISGRKCLCGQNCEP
ncbi:RNA-directed DNA polymerase (Reverse transcriptase), partial [Trifolium medium]|nr:RNA-directed DNA polymerase (Reverse transcriptase) [Trifolium medium]